MKRSTLLALLSAASLVMFAQTPTQTPPVKKASPAAVKKTPAPAPKKAAEPPLPPRPDGLYATFDISHMKQPVGKIVVRFFEKESPVTVKNFVDLAMGKKSWMDPKTGKRVTRPLFNGLTFHRVIPDFMIQGGDPEGTGQGGTDTIIDEFHPSLSMNKAGLMAMANAGPRTGSSQFFFTEKATPWLDGKHTIFGEIVEGLELENSLARVPRGPNDRPNDPIVMTKVTITRYPLGQPIWPSAAAPAGVKKSPVKTTPKTTPTPVKK